MPRTTRTTRTRPSADATVAVVDANGNGQTRVRVTRAAWNGATKSAPFGRVASPDGDSGVIIRLSAAGNRAAATIPAGDRAATLCRAAVHAASPAGMGGHVGRVFDGDIAAVVAPGKSRAEWRRDNKLRAPAVGR